MASTTPVSVTYPVDFITEKKTCELHEAVRNISLKAAVGYALTCESTALYRDNEIPAGYARVGVDHVEPGYESLELHFPGEDDERKLGDVQGGLILWPKKLIKFPGWTPPRPPSPSLSRHDDTYDDHHGTSPSRSPSPRQSPHQPTPQPTPEPSPEPSPPPIKAKGRKGMKAKGFRSPKHRLEPLPKVPKVPPPRPYDEPPCSKEVSSIWLQTEARRQATESKEKRKPAPKETYAEEQINWAVNFLTTPSQISMNRPDDYVRQMRKVAETSGKRRRDVAQLGQQSNQSIPPLKVTTDEDSGLEKDPAHRAQFAADAGISVSQLDNENLLSSTFEPAKWPWVYGKDLVSPDELKVLPTQMTRLHKWYKEVVLLGREMIIVRVTSEHFSGITSELTIPLEELYQLYQLDALDLSILSTYCL